MSKPKEFWIQKGTPDLIGDSFQEAEGFCVSERHDLPVIHVIEYSAYESIRAQCEKLEAALEQIRWQWENNAGRQCDNIAHEALTKYRQWKKERGEG